MPGVSLIIATWNRGERIAATLDSVLQQTVRPQQILVVDDCSTDETGIWVQKHYPNIEVLRTPKNLRSAGARNFGARQATQEILVFFDHDDLMFPHAIATFVELLQTYPEAAAAFCDHQYTNTVTGQSYPDHHRSQKAFHRLQTIPCVKQNELGRLYDQAIYRALVAGNLLQQPYAIRRSAFEAIQGYNEDIWYCEDWDLYLRLTRQFPVVLSDLVVSNHLVEGENLHLAPNQAEMHMKVIRNQMKADFPQRFRTWLHGRRRLAGYLKTRGDQAKSQSQGAAAWKSYLQSFWYWPFDHVVALRLTLWPLGIKI